MRVDRLDHVADRAAHLDRQDRLADQITGAVADNAAADDWLGLRVDDPLGQPFGAADGLGTAAGHPGELRHLDRAPLALGLGLGQTRPGDFRIGEDDGGNRLRLESDRLAKDDFDRDLALVGSFVGQHRLAGRVADGRESADWPCAAGDRPR